MFTMKNFRVQLLKNKNDAGSRMIINILANSASEAKQKTLSMYGVNCKIISIT